MIRALLFVLASTHAVHSSGVEFYSNDDYVGLIPGYGAGTRRAKNWKVDAGDCFTFKIGLFTPRVASVRTNENCIILFDAAGCTGYSIKLDSDVPSLSRWFEEGNSHDNFNRRSRSYKFCEKEEGGSNVNIDLYNETQYAGDSFVYDEICKCVSVPTEQASIASIDNHHSCIVLYENSNCEREGLNMRVFAGKSSVSEDLTKHEIYGKVGSLRPCDIPPECYNLQAQIYAFRVYEEPTDPTTTTLSMAAKTTFNNNGSATVIQEYSARREVRETTEVEHITLSRRIQTWSTSSTTSKEVKAGFLGFGKKTSESLTKSYSDTQENSEQNRTLDIHEETTEFAVSQKIEVPPCSKYTADSSIKVIEKFPMKYDTHFKLSGEFAQKKMTAEDLIELIDTMDGLYVYNHTIDDFTISAYATATMTMSFGVETEINGEGTRIQNCVP